MSKIIESIDENRRSRIRDALRNMETLHLTYYDIKETYNITTRQLQYFINELKEEK